MQTWATLCLCETRLAKRSCKRIDHQESSCKRYQDCKSTTDWLKKKTKPHLELQSQSCRSPARKDGLKLTRSHRKCCVEVIAARRGSTRGPLIPRVNFLLPAAPGGLDSCPQSKWTMDQFCISSFIIYMYIFYIFVSYFDFINIGQYLMSLRKKTLKFQKVCILLLIKHTPNTGEGE